MASCPASPKQTVKEIKAYPYPRQVWHSRTCGLGKGKKGRGKASRATNLEESTEAEREGEKEEEEEKERRNRNSPLPCEPLTRLSLAGKHFASLGL